MELRIQVEEGGCRVGILVGMMVSQKLGRIVLFLLSWLQLTVDPGSWREYLPPPAA